MRKYIASLMMCAACATSAFAVDASELKSPDVHVADAARMALEKAPDAEKADAEKALLEALNTQNNPLLKSGIIESLGKMQSKKARKQIKKIAETQGDEFPVAYLALAMYGDGDSSFLLEQGKKNPVALAAYNLTQKAKKCNKSPKLEDYSKSDENTKIYILRNLDADKSVKKSVLSIKPETEREAAGLAYVLSRCGGEDAMAREIELSNLYPSDNSIVQSMAATEGGDKLVIAESQKGNSNAIRTAGIRGIAEAEATILKIALTSSDGALRKCAYDALINIGMMPTMSALMSKITSGDKANLADNVRICAAVYQRLSGSDLQSVDKILTDMQKSGDATKSRIADKILPKNEVDVKKAPKKNKK